MDIKDSRIYWVAIITILVLVGFNIVSGQKSKKQNIEKDESLQISPTEQPMKPNKNIRHYDEAPKMTIDVKKEYTAVIKTTEGDITVKLYADKTPLTVNNFVFLARDKFYDGVIFHRVIKDFMIQGGDPTGTGMGGPGYKFEDETDAYDEFSKKGLLAMANSGPDTNGSQFFITHAPTPWLNGNHTIFGEVVEGMKVVDTIANTQVGAGDKPVKEIAIISITINEK